MYFVLVFDISCVTGGDGFQPLEGLLRARYASTALRKPTIFLPPFFNEWGWKRRRGAMGWGHPRILALQGIWPLDLPMYTTARYNAFGRTRYWWVVVDRSAEVAAAEDKRSDQIRNIFKNKVRF